MADHWSIEEVEATVSDYLSMLSSELKGDDYDKTAHRRSLLPNLNGRSEGAVEFKHQNISAILRELGCPAIDGYKPMSNYQNLLYDVVIDRLSKDHDLLDRISHLITAPIDEPEIDDLTAISEKPPASSDLGELDYSIVREADDRRPIKVDYIAQEARNNAIGLAGEQLVVRFEVERLLRRGQQQLSNRVEHVSQTTGDGLGYDILSYDEDGRERLIEVKTTSFGKRTPFYVTRNELSCSVEREDEYHLYRVFTFRRTPRLYWLRGRLDDQFNLNATQYEARR